MNKGNRMNDEEQRRFEAFLREFEPRRPRPLPADESAWRSWPRLAAAAVLVLAIGAVSLWIGVRHFAVRNAGGQPATANMSSVSTNQRPPISTLALTRAALDGSPEFDKEMDSMARRDLPSFNRKESMLRVLAKE
jgi:hypothetical protein